MFFMATLYLWDTIPLEVKYVHALTPRVHYQNYSVIHKLYLSYRNI